MLVAKVGVARSLVLSPQFLGAVSGFDAIASCRIVGWAESNHGEWKTSKRGRVLYREIEWGKSRWENSTATWLILPAIICLSQRLSHACLSISNYMAKLRMAHYISYNLLDWVSYLDNCRNPRANTCKRLGTGATLRRARLLVQKPGWGASSNL